jgi:mannosyltransferase OCH1-like enzyme
MIPKLIHQTWKTDDIPKRHQPFVNKIKSLNPEWSYKLWTDRDNDEFVKKEFPELYRGFAGFSRNIMRADVIRYLIMYKIGGVYLDLDYEVLKPFDFENKSIVLPLWLSVKEGDRADILGNFFLASVPGHGFWLDVINDLINNPPIVTDYTRVLEATGPIFMTKIYNSHRYHDIDVPEKNIYNPIHHPNTIGYGKKYIDKIRNNGVSLGIHYTWGSWIERLTLAYFKAKIRTEISRMCGRLRKKQ